MVHSCRWCWCHTQPAKMKNAISRLKTLDAARTLHSLYFLVNFALLLCALSFSVWFFVNLLCPFSFWAKGTYNLFRAWRWPRLCLNECPHGRIFTAEVINILLSVLPTRTHRAFFVLSSVRCFATVLYGRELVLSSTSRFWRRIVSFTIAFPP